MRNLTTAEATEFGSAPGALIGLGIDGEEGAELGAIGLLSAEEAQQLHELKRAPVGAQP